MDVHELWNLVLEDHAIWRAIPLKDHLVVGVDGVWRDLCARGVGPRGFVTAGASDDTGGTIILDYGGRAIKRLPNVAPARRFGRDFLGLRGQHEVVLCSERGAVHGSITPLGQESPIRVLVSMGASAVVVATEQPLLQGAAEVGTAEVLKRCECAVVDAGLNVTAHFEAADVIIQAASDRFLFGCAFQSSEIMRTSLCGRTEVIADLSRPRVLNRNDEWAREDVFAHHGPIHWTTSYDDVADRLLASTMSPPHAVAYLETDGRLLWCRVVNWGCCAGPPRRIGEMIVAPSGCGGVVTWLSVHGDVLHQSHEKPRRLDDPIFPTDVEPGPGGCVFAFRSGRLCYFHPDGSEGIISTSDPDRPFGVSWWPSQQSVVSWSGPTISQISASA